MFFLVTSLTGFPPPPTSSLVCSGRCYLRRWLGPFGEWLSFPGSLSYIQEVYIVLNLFGFLLLICLLVQGGGSSIRNLEGLRENDFPPLDRPPPFLIKPLMGTDAWGATHPAHPVREPACCHGISGFQQWLTCLQLQISLSLLRWLTRILSTWLQASDGEGGSRSAEAPRLYLPPMIHNSVDFWWWPPDSPTSIASLRRFQRFVGNLSYWACPFLKESIQVLSYGLFKVESSISWN